MAKKYSPAEIEHHLSYEIDMLNGAYRMIPKLNGVLEKGGATASEQKIILNLMKEAVGIHARQLMEFFTTKRENSAYRFAPNYDPVDKPPLFRKLNNQIAHLMDERTIDPTKKISDFVRLTEIMQWLDSEVKKFRVALAAAGAPYDTIVFPNIDSMQTFSASDTPSATGAISVTSTALGPTGPVGT